MYNHACTDNIECRVGQKCATGTVVATINPDADAIWQAGLDAVGKTCQLKTHCGE